MRFRRGIALSIGAVLVLGTGCRHPATPEALQPLGNRNRFTCCNIHYESDHISDANYIEGKKLPAGTPVVVETITSDSISFVAGDVKLTLSHDYGAKQESLRQYLDKVLVLSDPKPKIASYPRAVRHAIESGRAERGMTREQVIVSLGYPPAHRTPSLQEREWTYWYSRWLTYKVAFDDHGKVADVIGKPAPTAQLPIAEGEAQPHGKGSTKSRKKPR